MIRLTFDSAHMECDLICSEEGTDTSRPLETAVLISLFCDATAGPEADIPVSSDRRGWWADAYNDGDVIGSALWQVITQKATDLALQRARRWALASLEWMITDSICRDVEVETWWLEGRKGYLGLLVTLYKPDGSSPQNVGPWEIYYAVD